MSPAKGDRQHPPLRQTATFNSRRRHLYSAVSPCSKRPMRQHIAAAIVLAVLVSVDVFSQVPAANQPRQTGTRPEDNRPPVFFREEWKHQFDRGGPPEGPVGQEHVAHRDLEL